MTREWKPGDVALVTCDDGEERRALCGVRWNDDSLVWVFRDRAMRDVASSSARPLVVIDPEDAATDPRRFLESLSRNWYQAPDDFKLYGGTHLLDWLASQFDLPAPPRPPEPTGLGAVVEDEGGTRWTRVEPAAKAITRNPWYPADDDERQPADYADITAVRILSEGVDQ